MAFDLWTHQFCLACDKQTDGAAYCSESCRLADFEKASAPSSGSSSPGFTPPSYSWPSEKQSTKFYLSPAYDFGNPQPYGRTPVPRSNVAQRAEPSRQPARSLTPSSSHSSLCSMRSNLSSNETFQISENSKKELQAYAIAFEQARLQRRRSY